MRTRRGEFDVELDELDPSAVRERAQQTTVSAKRDCSSDWPADRLVSGRVLTGEVL